MAKKSFILFNDSLSVLDELTDEQAGKLFKAIRDFQTGKETELDFGLKMAFLPFKNQFIRDFENYAELCESQRIKGLKSAEARANRSQPNSTDLTAGSSGQPNPTESTYTDKDKDTDKDNDTVKDKDKKRNRAFAPPTCNDVIQYFTDNGYTEAAAIKAWNYYEAGQWKDGKGNQVKNWKQKMQGVWFKPENESKTVSPEGTDYSKLLGYRSDLHGKPGFKFSISPGGGAISYDRI